MRKSLTGLAFATLVILGSATASAAPILKSVIRVDGPQVTLGDLFDQAGDKATIAVSMAPRPGQRGLLNVSHIAMVARNNNFGWQGGTGISQVIVHRSSRIVPNSMIEQMITSALTREGLEGPLEISLRNLGLEMHVTVDTPPSVAIRDLDINRHNGYFAVTLVAPANDPHAKPVRVVGRAHRLIEIPMLVRRVDVGDIISAGDLNWVSVREIRAHRNVAMAEQDIVGMSPRRPLKVGAPIRLSDIAEPITVAKGTVVTMAVQSGVMQLTAAGRALDSGAVGDVIRVANIKSRRIVLATILTPNRVTVSAAQKVLTAAK